MRCRDQCLGKKKGTGTSICGQFINSPQKSIASIIFYKDLTASVALGTIDPSKAVGEGSIGEVTFKAIDSAGYNLILGDDIRAFTKTFIPTLRSTMTLHT